MTEDDDHSSGLLDKTLRDVLSRVRESGPLEVQLGNDVYTIALRRDTLTDEARKFLMKGGPAS